MDISSVRLGPFSYLLFVVSLIVLNNIRARDRPDKTLGIEIYNCFDYRRMRLHWNGCGLILHELCHLIHQVVLPDGLDNAKVQALFEQARASGLYNRTLRRDWAGMPVCHDMAYAVSDIAII